MEIQFTNIDGLWVAEFEVTKDFNLHLERDTEGRLDIYQRTAGGEPEYIYDIGYLNKRTVYDNDFQALVYPKWIKIKSAVKPLIATITTDGEVNEVVYQAKDIEITSNGTTKVTADTGYTALGSVNIKVKVNVPSEGGGSGGGDASTIEYVDISAADEEFKGNIMALSVLIRANIENTILAAPASYIFKIAPPINNILAICTDTNISMLIQNELITIKDLMIKVGAWETYSSLPRITKEEFYNLNA